VSTVSALGREAGQRRVAAITGAGSGIGEATAYRLSMDGFDIAVLDIDEARAKAVARAVTDRHGSALPIRVDVTDGNSVEGAFAAIEVWRRTPDVLVNSAGIIAVASVVDCAPTDFRAVMDVNVTGTFLCSQRAAKDMLAQRYGRIVNLSSISAARAGVGRIAYGTSKGAVTSLTRQLAMELGKFGITANCVAPGPIMTAMTQEYYTAETRQAFESMIPARRLGTVSEVAHAISFLASEGAGYINGIMLAVDGGYLAAGIGTTGNMRSEGDV
jgi:NAD(P)-dependent dehydrogenase (short-subunit alcohol dehydrogenase family)